MSEHYCIECKYLCTRYDRNDWEVYGCSNENGRGTNSPERTACKGFKREGNMWGYEVWHDGQCLIDSENADVSFESEDEALEEGTWEAENRIQEWKDEGTWNGETLEDFDVMTKEV